MSDRNDIVKVAVDSYHGKVEGYSVKQSRELVYDALVQANGGSTVVDYRRIRDGKCGELFNLVEQILGETVKEGLQENDCFMSLVDFRNVAEGDSPVFKLMDNDMFVVADVADGTQGIRRQRLGGASETRIPTTVKAVKIYEELQRILARRVDWTHMIDAVGEAFQQKLLNDAYTLWDGITSENIGGNLGGNTYFPAAGSYDEDALLKLIEHVEAAAGGKPATIIGTKRALRNMKIDSFGEGAKNDLYTMGYVGKFYGTPVVATPQRHQPGSNKFTFNDKVLTIVAADEKPIKCVYEGDPLIIPGTPSDNGDLTQEYLYAEKYGMGLLASRNTGIGRYTLS